MIHFPESESENTMEKQFHGQASESLRLGLLLAVVVAVLKLLIGVLVIALFENSMARLRFVETSRITWAGFGFAFLAFVSLLVA